MQVRFFLGPAGSGKTYRCLAEARAALLASPEGAPLLFLAPKQATFQLERQLLADPGLPGYTRLQILSLERLAEFILTECSATPPRLLNEEGRLMVLRTLLARKQKDLRIFHATARLRGFEQELSGVIRELLHAHISPGQLRELAKKVDSAARLDAKLSDLADLFEAYLRWLDQHHLQDHDRLLVAAAEALQKATNSSAGKNFDLSAPQLLLSLVEMKTEDRHQATIKPLRIAGLWLDGFAEMSPQEMDLLAALIPFCARATLAFNFDLESIGQNSWLGTWSLMGQTLRQLQQRVAARPGLEVVIERLERDPAWNRFTANPVLRHLEQHWSEPKPFVTRHSDTSGPDPCEPQPQLKESIRVAACANQEAEAVLAAREILRFVRSGGRFREVAVLVRNLDQYYDLIRRVFASYEIPVFLDRREPVGHHSMAELTRSALRTLAFNWQIEDWFGALKTGLVLGSEAEIDRLENEALGHGWKGHQWRQPFRTPEDPELENWVEPLRQRLSAPFQKLELALGPRPSGKVLADALLVFWRELDVEGKLERWSARSGKAVHVSFWEQMQLWLDNVTLAFSNESLPLRDWLPIVEAGLASQTVGVIPPALDQVLVGAVDRSRNPDLRVVVVLGMNESVFPSPPKPTTLLSESDRERLEGLQVRLGLPRRSRLGQERYLGYVACTRASERLVLTYALNDETGTALNPSSFVTDLQRLFPNLEIESPVTPRAFEHAEHPRELLAPVLQACGNSARRSEVFAPLLAIPAFAGLVSRMEQFQSPGMEEQLSPELAERLYGSSFATSVSRLENFAACPFKFFIGSGLRAEEREYFEFDVREQGSFQHEVLALFHKKLRNEGKRWRDLTPQMARERIAEAASTLTQPYRSGLLTADNSNSFIARSMTLTLQDFVEVIIDWMKQYDFDPHAVELGFGQDGDPLPPWKIQLDDRSQLLLRGKIDRVDLWRKPGDKAALCVVIDYKSSTKRLDATLMAHGIQLQLASYLNVLRCLPETAALFEIGQIIPAGVFYVNLRGQFENGKTRRDVLKTVSENRKFAYRHMGRFDANIVRRLDRRDVKKGDQFSYAFNQDGSLSKVSREALDAASFKKLLDSTENSLFKIGRAILAGVACVDPYTKGGASACDQCQYQAVCRIDPWTHEFRVLKPGS